VKQASDLMHKIILLAAVMAHCLTACTIVRYYEVKPMAQSFDKTAGDTHNILKQVRTDLKKKRVILYSLKKQGAKMESTPYVELNALLGPLQKHGKQCEGKAKELQGLRTKFRALAKGKKKITSKSPDYARVDKLRARAESLMPDLEKTVKAYKKDAKIFESLMSKGRIGELDVIKTRTELRNFLKKLDANISLVRSRGAKIQAAALGKHQNTYNQITVKLALIEQERVAVSKLIERFNKKAGTQKKLWIGPGLVTFDIMTTGEAQARKIQKIGSEISALAKALKH